MITQLHKKANSNKHYYLQNQHILNISRDTTEEIKQEYLNDFLKNTLLSSGHTISNNSRVFYSYFKDAGIYEIYLINNFKTNSLFLPCIFTKIYDKTKNELFLADNFFALFEKGKMKLFKELSQSISKDDILEYLQKRYQIGVDKIYQLSHKDIENFKTEYENDKNRITPKLLALQRGFKPILLLSYTLFLTTIFAFHYHFISPKEIDSSTLNNKTLAALQKQYQSLIDKTSNKTSVVIDTLHKIKQYNIKLRSIHLNRNKLHIFLNSKDKLRLLNFTESFKKKIQINKLGFDKKNKNFSMEAEVAF